jgi:hypothetical protein
MYDEMIEMTIITISDLACIRRSDTISPCSGFPNGPAGRWVGYELNASQPWAGDACLSFECFVLPNKLKTASEVRQALNNRRLGVQSGKRYTRAHMG